MKRLDLSNKLKALNESMNQTEFVNELRKTIKIKDLKGDVVQKAFELYQKNVAMRPADAYEMASNYMDNMAFEGMKFVEEGFGGGDDIDDAYRDARKAYQDQTGRKFDDAPDSIREKYFYRALKRYGLTIRQGRIVREHIESLEALAEHVKQGISLVDSLFRYQSEAYFDTFTKAKKLREAGSLPELDWESEEMLATDIGESVVLENGETVWLDVPYLEEDNKVDLSSIREDYDEVENESGMIGEPDRFFDAEERQEAYNDLQDALQGNYMDDYIIDGSCPACAGSGYMDGEDEVYNDETEEYEEGSECDGFGNYGCDEGEMTYGSDGPSWVEIIKHDKQQADRKDATANYPGDEEVIKGLVNMMKNMDDPRQAYQQMQVDYPQMGKAQRSNLIAKAKQMAFPESVEIDEIRKLAGLNELDDKRTDIEKISDLLKDAIGPDNNGGDMYELYAELESMNPDIADEIKLLAKEMYGVKLEEGKSPHKKGTKKYKKHMAAMHAENLEENPNFLDPLSRNTDKSAPGVPEYIELGGIRYKFFPNKINTDGSKGLWVGDIDDVMPPRYPANSKTGKALLKRRANAMVKYTPSYKAKLKSKVMTSEAEYQGKKVELNKPKRGGSKKYYVYVKTPKGNVKKISFGDVTGLKAKAGNKKAAKSFAARHNCEKKNDKQKAGYWACRLPRYGLVKGGKWW